MPLISNWMIYTIIIQLDISGWEERESERERNDILWLWMPKLNRSFFVEKDRLETNVRVFHVSSSKDLYLASLIWLYMASR